MATYKNSSFSFNALIVFIYLPEISKLKNQGKISNKITSFPRARTTIWSRNTKYHVS